jgi:hypothetical protein
MRTYCSFAHVLNLFWMPLIEYMDSCTSEPAPVWTKNLALNHTALLAEMAGTVMGADEPLEMDKWIDFIKDTLCRLLKVDVPSRFILQVMSPVVPFHVAPTPANALHLLRSGWCCKLVGPALAAQTNRLLLAEIADVPVQLHSDEALNLSVRQDLIATLENLHCGPQVDETQDQLMQKAVHLILSLEITTQVLERFKLNEADLEGMDARPNTWVDLAVLQVVGDPDRVAEHLPEALRYIYTHA